MLGDDARPRQHREVRQIEAIVARALEQRRRQGGDVGLAVQQHLDRAPVIAREAQLGELGGGDPQARQEANGVHVARRRLAIDEDHASTPQVFDALDAIVDAHHEQRGVEVEPAPDVGEQQPQVGAALAGDHVGRGRQVREVDLTLHGLVDGVVVGRADHRHEAPPRHPAEVGEQRRELALEVLGGQEGPDAEADGGKVGSLAGLDGSGGRGRRRRRLGPLRDRREPQRHREQGADHGFPLADSATTYYRIQGGSANLTPGTAGRSACCAGPRGPRRWSRRRSGTAGRRGRRPGGCPACGRPARSSRTRCRWPRCPR